MAVPELNFQEDNFIVGDDDELITKQNRVNAKMDAFAEGANAYFSGPPLNITGVTATLSQIHNGRLLRVDSAPRLGVVPEAEIGTRLEVWNSSTSDLTITKDTGVDQIGELLLPAGGYFRAIAVQLDTWLLVNQGVTGTTTDNTNDDSGGTPETSGRTSDGYAQTLGTPIINAAERDSQNVVRVYYGSPTSGPYGAGVTFEIEVGGQIFTSTSSGYKGIVDAPAGTTATLRAVNNSANTRSADVTETIVSV